MPWKRYGKCVFKITKSGKKGEKQGCSTNSEEAKKYLKALYANAGGISEEIEKYFSNDALDFEQTEIDDYFTEKEDEEENLFNDAKTEDLLNPDIPAPWSKI